MNKNRVTTFLPFLFGVLYGLLYIVGDSTSLKDIFNVQGPQALEGLALLIFLPFALRLWQQFIHEKIIPLNLSVEEQTRYFKLEQLSWLILLIPNQLVTNWQPSWALTLLAITVLIAIQCGFFFISIGATKREILFGSERYIAVLFLVSGFSALIYQVVWQRVLFATFGINSEAVTVIVSVFMFGLGVGALVGGVLQKKFPNHLLAIFIVLEILIGLFGLISLPLIQFIGTQVNNNSTMHLIGWSYLILAIPTLLMGATLPVLVSFLQKYFNNLGKTVGLLYAFNTIGSAIAAYFTVEVLFVLLGQTSTVVIAAVCNLATALLIFNASHFLRPVPLSDHSIPSPLNSSPNRSKNLPYFFAFISLIFIGYISLSQEIIWYRLIGFSSGGRPQIFGMLLTAFLIGIALGSLRAKKICESQQDPYQWMVRGLLLASLAFYLATPSVAIVSALISKSAGPILAYALTGLVAYYMGGMLPMLIHIGVNEQRKESSMTMSWLYFANIIGATLGPLMTGFILLEYLDLEENVLLLSVLTIVFLLVLLYFVPKERAYKIKVLGATFFSIACLSILHHPLYQGHLERIQLGEWAYEPFKYTLQNRAGIITVKAATTDIIYGGGIYDGGFNINLATNENNIDRAYLIPALHRSPKKILEIGFSSGSWAKILTQYDLLESLSIVEINKGYPQMVAKYPAISDVLTHSKVKLYYDDGRRWLKNNPNEKFDFILMNTTFHWRSNGTNLLSKEFLEICKQHLKPGGVIYYNTTNSKDVVLTAAHVFKYVTTYVNFVAASDSPFNMSSKEKLENLKHFKNSEGLSFFETNSTYNDAFIKLANTELPEVQQSIKLNKKLQLITDDNMVVEFKLH